LDGDGSTSLPLGEFDTRDLGAVLDQEEQRRHASAR
jgi:hypothetical protein